MSKQETTTTLRPIGVSFSSFFYGAAGVYYLIFPFIVQDTSLVHILVLGGLSLLGSLGVLKMTRWGLWIGLLLFPAQVIAPAFALDAALRAPGVLENPLATLFIASLVVLMFFASLSFLLVLDKRRSFK